MNAATSTTSTNKPTTKDYVYRVSAAVANAILVTLGIGLLFQTIAQFIHWQPLYDAGTMGTVLLAPALGVAVASQLDVNTLVIFSAMISATVGSNAVHFTTKAVNFCRRRHASSSSRQPFIFNRTARQCRCRSIDCCTCRQISDR